MGDAMSNDLQHELWFKSIRAQWEAAMTLFYRDLPRGEMPNHLLVEIPR